MNICTFAINRILMTYFHRINLVFLVIPSLINLNLYKNTRGGSHHYRLIFPLFIYACGMTYFFYVHGNFFSLFFTKVYFVFTTLLLDILTYKPFTSYAFLICF